MERLHLASVLIFIIISSAGCFGFGSDSDVGENGKILLENRDDQSHDVRINTSVGPNKSIEMKPDEETQLRLFDSPGRYRIEIHVDDHYTANTTVSYFENIKGELGGAKLTLFINTKDDIEFTVSQP